MGNSMSLIRDATREEVKYSSQLSVILKTWVCGLLLHVLNAELPYGL